jgi:hypothetical protein
MEVIANPGGAREKHDPNTKWQIKGQRDKGAEAQSREKNGE